MRNTLRQSLESALRDRRGPGRNDDDDVVVGDARPIDGRGTNSDNPTFGATGAQLSRLSEPSFADGIGAMVTDRPNPREISNIVVDQEGDEPSADGASDLLWAWGQFIDHDLDLTRQGNTEPVPIAVPTGDKSFDPQGTGSATLPFFRANPVAGTGQTTPREFANEITAFLDASMVYGSNAQTAASLRASDGKLLLDEAGLLPTNEAGRILAGDIRAGENQALFSLQTLFAREHNRLVDELAARDPSLSPDELFQAARTRVEAQVQAITFNEFLPVLVGKDAISEYSGFDSSVDPGISAEFSTAIFRLGHSLLSPEVQRLLENGQTIEAGNLTLAQAFGARPADIAANGGIDPLLRGLAAASSQELDNQIVDDVRSLLLDVPANGITDLAAINIQRGRDLGLPTYNELREALGLAQAEGFDDITSDPEVAARLEQAYGNVDLVDLWVGALSEDHIEGGMVGELMATVLVDQFQRVRDGDPFWSQASDLPRQELDALWSTRLSDVIERNTGIETIQDNVFLTYQRTGGGERADALTGSAARDLLIGLGGRDQLSGGDGDDQLEGGRGRDLLVGGRGNNSMSGDDGADVILDGDGADSIAGGGGRDILVMSGALGDYDVEIAKGVLKLTDANGDINVVEGVERIHFLESGTTHSIGRRGLVEARAGDRLERLLQSDEFRAQAASNEGDAANIEARLAEIVELDLGADPGSANSTTPTTTAPGSAGSATVASSTAGPAAIAPAAPQVDVASLLLDRSDLPLS